MPEWPDMDPVIKLHGKKDMLGRSIPTTVDESYDSYMDMMGAAIGHSETPRRVYRKAAYQRSLSSSEKTQSSKVLHGSALGGSRSWSGA